MSSSNIVDFNAHYRICEIGTYSDFTRNSFINTNIIANKLQLFFLI